MNRSPKSPTLVLATSFLLVLGAAACGGGGGGGGGGGPTTPNPGITFTASNVTAPAVRLVRTAGSGNMIELAVRADQIPPVYGLAFDLSFPSNVLRFDSFADGGLLGAGGAQTSLQVAENPAGTLVIGYSRLGAVGMTGGSGDLVILRFTAAGTGSGSFSFSRNRLIDATGSEIRGPSWGGGSVQVAQ